MTKAGKCQLCWHDPGQQRREQGDESDDVISPAAPDQPREHGDQQNEQYDLIGGHALL